MQGWINGALKEWAEGAGLNLDWVSMHCLRIGGAADARQCLDLEAVEELFGGASDAAFRYRRNNAMRLPNAVSLLGQGKNCGIDDQRRAVVWHSIAGPLTCTTELETRESPGDDSSEILSGAPLGYFL